MSQAEDIFRTLYAENANALGRFFRERGCSPAEGEDLTQDTFLRAYQDLTSGVVREPGRRWLTAIAWDVWRNKVRSRSPARRRGDPIPLDSLDPFRATEEPRQESDLPAEDSSRLLYEKLESATAISLFKSDLLILDDELVRFLKVRPERMRDLSPRKFEELVASLLADLGYDVELTSRGADGGVDIFATQKNTFGEALVIVDCKRYAPEKRVGVGIVRALYGLSESFRATKALLATTSFFTQPALEFEAQVPYRLGLKDYDSLVEWIRDYKGRACNPGLHRTPGSTIRR